MVKTKKKKLNKTLKLNTRAKLVLVYVKTYELRVCNVKSVALSAAKKARLCVQSKRRRNNIIKKRRTREIFSLFLSHFFFVHSTASWAQSVPSRAANALAKIFYCLLFARWWRLQGDIIGYTQMHSSKNILFYKNFAWNVKSMKNLLSWLDRKGQQKARA